MDSSQVAEVLSSNDRRNERFNRGCSEGLPVVPNYSREGDEYFVLEEKIDNEREINYTNA